MPLAYDTLSSPLGEIVLIADGKTLVGLSFGGKLPSDRPRDANALGRFTREIAEYLGGERRKFSFAIAQEGTPFQNKVWAALRTIPYGTTISYGELARWVGHPNAYRACGTANGRNQIAIVVPCHRVVAAGGKLGGYGGELWRKEWLLQREGAR